MPTSVTYTLSFPFQFDPATGRPYPGMEVIVHGPRGSDRIVGHVDTGADLCYFSGERAGALGLDLLSGRAVTATTATGLQARVYLHRVELEFLGRRVQVEVAFSAGPIHREVLGRQGVLDQIQLGVRERYETLLLELEFSRTS